MFGAILGDIIGSPFEFDRGGKTKDFPLFSKGCRFTDDTVMTLAVAHALLQTDTLEEQKIKTNVVVSMQRWGNRYPQVGYGGRFYAWLNETNPRPYNSWGNGSAMRVSAVGWLYDSLETTRQVARWTAEVTHNHPEGIKGAESVASAIWMARNGKSKKEIREYIVREFGYDLDRTLEEIRPTYSFDVSCQGSVPQAMLAFFEGRDFEDVIRGAVSLGGDTDTIGAIAGSMAQACYGVPRVLYDVVMNDLPQDLKGIVVDFVRHLEERGVELRFENPLTTNWRVEEKSRAFGEERTREKLVALLYALANRMTMEGELFVPVEFAGPLFGDEAATPPEPGDTGTLNREVKARLLTVGQEDGTIWFPAFTGLTQAEKGEPSSLIPERIVDILRRTMENTELSGVILNPWQDGVRLTRELIGLLLDEVK